MSGQRKSPRNDAYKPLTNVRLENRAWVIRRSVIVQVDVLDADELMKLKPFGEIGCFVPKNRGDG